MSKNSIQKKGDELQGVYRSFMHTAPHGTTLPLFECRLTFYGYELGAGRGDTKRRAREEASRKVLRKMEEANRALSLASIKRLEERNNRVNGTMIGVAAVAVAPVPHNPSNVTMAPSSAGSTVAPASHPMQVMS